EARAQHAMARQHLAGVGRIQAFAARQPVDADLDVADVAHQARGDRTLRAPRQQAAGEFIARILHAGFQAPLPLRIAPLVHELDAFDARAFDVLVGARFRSLETIRV